VVSVKSDRQLENDSIAPTNILDAIRQSSAANWKPNCTAINPIVHT